MVLHQPAADAKVPAGRRCGGSRPRMEVLIWISAAEFPYMPEGSGASARGGAGRAVPMPPDAELRFYSRPDGELVMPPRDRSEEHTSELQSLMRISYAVFCLKKKKKHTYHTHK